MFYVYCGYVSADNYDSSEYPTYDLKECKNIDEVIALKLEFDEEIYDECSNIIFRIFEGIERTLTPIEVVKNYKLEP